MTTVVFARSVSSALARGWQAYLSVLERHPCRTLALNTCFLMGSGDVIAQVALEKRRRLRDYDVLRTLRFCAVGLVVAGPVMHVWYRFLDTSIRGSGLKMALRKMCADQGFFMPTYLIGYVGIMGVTRGDRPSDIASKLRRDFVPMMQVSYSIWPAVQVANFLWAPPHHRVLVINVVGLIWNTFMAWRAEKQLHRHPAEQEQTSTVEHAQTSKVDHAHHSSKAEHAHHPSKLEHLHAPTFEEVAPRLASVLDTV